MPRRKEDESNVVALPFSFMSRAGALAAHRAAEDFVPTAQMQAARGRCQELVDAGTLSPIDWLPVLQREHLVSSAEWREWLVMEGFDQWWYDGLYPAPSSTSLKALSHPWLRGLEKALAKGEPRTLEWYHRMVLQKTDGGKSPLELMLLDREGSGNKWRPAAVPQIEKKDDDGSAE